MALALAACSQAETPTPAEVAEETAPVPLTIDDEPVTEIIDADAPVVEASEPETEPEPDHDHDHSDDESGAHDNDDHDHDRDHDHAGGEAHVHGGGDMSLSIEGKTLTVELVAPLANFGQRESGDDVIGDSAFSNLVRNRRALLRLNGGGCNEMSPRANVEADGDHASGRIVWTGRCQSPDDLKSATLQVFDAFPGFEHVDAIALIGDQQVAAELTADSPALILD
ncbi:MAG: DUF2796 domain-containing protein [Pseudomonadota bacterium]